MKKKNLFSVALMSCLLAFTSCSNDDDFAPNENKVVEQAFNQKYPNVNAKWEMEKGFFKAEFYENNLEKDAWFSPAGEWLLTETDVTYQQLPSQVKVGFESSAYAQWRVDDVDMLERPLMNPIYVIEVEKGKLEYDLHFSSNGMLIKEVLDTDNDDVNYPTVPSDQIMKAVKDMYPSAQILEIENEKNGIEVDILDGGIHKEVMFSGKSEWMYTSWDVIPSSLPAAVLEAVTKLGYSQMNIDDAEIIEHKDGKTYYKLELEKGESERDVYFTAEGNEVKNPIL